MSSPDVKTKPSLATPPRLHHCEERIWLGGNLALPIYFPYLYRPSPCLLPTFGLLFVYLSFTCRLPFAYHALLPSKSSGRASILVSQN